MRGIRRILPSLSNYDADGIRFRTIFGAVNRGLSSNTVVCPHHNSLHFGAEFVHNAHGKTDGNVAREQWWVPPLGWRSINPSQLCAHFNTIYGRLYNWFTKNGRFNSSASFAAIQFETRHPRYAISVRLFRPPTVRIENGNDDFHVFQAQSDWHKEAFPEMRARLNETYIVDSGKSEWSFTEFTAFTSACGSWIFDGSLRR